MSKFYQIEWAIVEGGAFAAALDANETWANEAAQVLDAIALASTKEEQARLQTLLIERTIGIGKVRLLDELVLVKP